MTTVRRLALAAIVLSPTAAHADEPSPFAVVKAVKATSQGKGEDGPHLPRHAFDGYDTPGTQTEWCTADANAKGQSVTVTLASPRMIDHVQLANDKHLTAVEIVTDAGTTPAKRDERGVFIAEPKASSNTVTVRITEVDATVKRPVCISDVTIGSGHRSLVLLHGVPGIAVTRIASSIAALDKALARCDAGAIAKVVALPVEYDYIDGGDRSAHGKLASAAAVAKLCRARGSLGKLEAGAEPAASGASGLAIDAGDGFRWVLTWRAGTWRLAGIEGTGPSRH